MGITTRVWSPLELIQTRDDTVDHLDAMPEGEEEDPFPKTINSLAGRISQVWGNRNWTSRNGPVRERSRQDAVARLDAALRDSDRDLVDAVMAAVVKVWGIPIASPSDR